MCYICKPKQIQLNIQVIMTERTLERLPDEVQNIVLSFLDAHTRLRCIREKYPISVLENKLYRFPKSMHTMLRLPKWIKHVETIVKKFVCVISEDYRRSSWYIDLCNAPAANLYEYEKNQSYKEYYSEKFIYMIVVGLKNYTNMYNQTDDPETHYAVEKSMLKLYTRIVLT